MRKLLTAALLIGSVLLPNAAFAAERTVIFAIEKMICVTCPYIVKNSMASVPGVTSVTISFSAKTATVTFDDAKATVAAIAGASTDAGYPARPAQQGS
jgi:mercuric ion binding protein